MRARDKLTSGADVEPSGKRLRKTTPLVRAMVKTALLERPR